jgi:hypothetical protein
LLTIYFTSSCPTSNCSFSCCICDVSSSNFAWTTIFSCSVALHCSMSVPCTYFKAWVDFFVSSFSRQIRALNVSASRWTQGSASRAHQQALNIGPFGNTYEADAVSPEVAMGGLQDIDVYNQGEIKWIQYKINTVVI